MRGLEGIPQYARIADKPITCIERLWQVEPREAPLAALGIGGLVVTIQTRGDIFGIANAMESKFFNHQARDDLRLARYLQRALLGERLLLTNEEREQLDLLAVECIVYIPQPFVFIFVVAEPHRKRAEPKQKRKCDAATDTRSAQERVWFPSTETIDLLVSHSLCATATQVLVCLATYTSALRAG